MCVCVCVYTFSTLNLLSCIKNCMYFLIKTLWTCTYGTLLLFVKWQRSKQNHETGFYTLVFSQWS